ncbi:signal transduction histidine kinase [Sphingomonas leidyi]|uniref:histidine kinase n=1 Tax=Sphingomonas leidyi TaxID=68569 RepID=A0A7X5UZ67_9SPHN|nr:HAMP domain-containing sensor histidine kinase [Sphingomonas leidyi]NIJ64942.1 signal transduction histidine kinase [Sphingomonas leidyi]
MARALNRIVTRVWLLAGMMTFITIAMSVAVYYGATVLHLHQIGDSMPPKARAEFERLVRSGQTDSDRFFDLHEQYSGSVMLPSDWLFLAVIGIVSTSVGGGIAYVFARRISAPISAVSLAASQVAEGERGVRVEAVGLAGETAELVDSFNRMAADLEAYERERKILTAGIAHELRTPLTILKGRLHGLTDGFIDPSTDEPERLLRQVEQLSRIVEDLRTLAHADAHVLELDLRVVDLARVVQFAIVDLRPEAEAAGVTIGEACQPARVRADPVRMRQVVMNLISNAIRHGADGNAVEISVAVEGAAAVLRVADEGRGFEEGDERRLFMPFWRAARSQVAVRSGSGLGLALTAKLVEAHGGRIVAANRSDRSGACFLVYLPLCD